MEELVIALHDSRKVFKICQTAYSNNMTSFFPLFCSYLRAEAPQELVRTTSCVLKGQLKKKEQWPIFRNDSAATELLKAIFASQEHLLSKPISSLLLPLFASGSDTLSSELVHAIALDILRFLTTQSLELLDPSLSLIVFALYNVSRKSALLPSSFADKDFAAKSLACCTLFLRFFGPLLLRVARDSTNDTEFSDSAQRTLEQARRQRKTAQVVRQLQTWCNELMTAKGKEGESATISQETSQMLTMTNDILSLARRISKDKKLSEDESNDVLIGKSLFHLLDHFSNSIHIYGQIVEIEEAIHLYTEDVFHRRFRNKVDDLILSKRMDSITRSSSMLFSDADTTDDLSFTFDTDDCQSETAVSHVAPDDEDDDDLGEFLFLDHDSLSELSDPSDDHPVDAEVVDATASSSSSSSSSSTCVSPVSSYSTLPAPASSFFAAADADLPENKQRPSMTLARSRAGESDASQMSEKTVTFSSSGSGSSEIAVHRLSSVPRSSSRAISSLNDKLLKNRKYQFDEMFFESLYFPQSVLEMFVADSLSKGSAGDNEDGDNASTNSNKKKLAWPYRKQQKLWISVVAKSAAREFGMYPPFLQLFEEIPSVFGTMWQMLREVAIVGQFPRFLKQVVAVAVSRANECPSCLKAHKMLAMALGNKAARHVLEKGESELDKENKHARSLLKLYRWAAATSRAEGPELCQPPFLRKFAPEVIGSVLVWNYVNRIISVFFPDRKAMPTFIVKLFGPIMRWKMGGIKYQNRSASFNLFPMQPTVLQSELSWAIPDPTVSAAISRFDSSIEQASFLIIPDSIRSFMRNLVAKWDGAGITGYPSIDFGAKVDLNGVCEVRPSFDAAQKEAWIAVLTKSFEKTHADSLAELSGREREGYRMMLRVALITAFAKHEMVTKDIADFEVLFPHKWQYLSVIAWSSMAVSKRVAFWTAEAGGFNV